MSASAALFSLTGEAEYLVAANQYFDTIEKDVQFGGFTFLNKYVLPCILQCSYTLCACSYMYMPQRCGLQHTALAPLTPLLHSPTNRQVQQA